MDTTAKKILQIRRGFALVATITMMVLLAMMALAMLSFSTIELRAARTDNAQAEAKANARLGLLLALGRLQSSLGPDARATAYASILDTDPTTEGIDGVRHSHWLGAFPTINPSNPDDGLLSPRDLRDWSLQNMEWLVSSSATNDSLDPTATLSGDAVTLGQFMIDPSINIPENSGVNGLAPDQLNKVQAGLVKLEDNSGRYAWWVSDESMKARVDTRASQDGSTVLDGTQIDAAAQQRNSYLTIQSTDFTSQLPGYRDAPEKLFKVITHNQLDLLGRESSDSSWKNWSKLNQDKFTPYSSSLPVDVANGRLKQDLTAYIKGSYTGLDQQSMIDTRFSIDGGTTPTFDRLKQWANMVTDNQQPQAVVAPDNNSSSPRHGLHPVITQGAVAMQHCYQVLSPRTFHPVYMFKPQIQLWNPHNVPLEAQDYIVQIGYQFRWWMQTHTRNTDKATYDIQPLWHSWEEHNNHRPLPVHKPADNESIKYQDNKRFFTFVIKNQAFKAGESLIFYAKPPSRGPISGIPLNMNQDADTDILNNYSNDDELNLLINEGNLDEFFYYVSPSTGTLDAGSTANLTVSLKTESNFQSQAIGTGIGDPLSEDLDMHMNLYAFQNDKPTLLHAIKKPQRNTRNGNWQRPTYPLSRYQNGEIFASATYDIKSPLVNLGSSILASNFDIFQGSFNANQPPKAGQPHPILSQWNIRHQESFSSSDAWDGSAVEASSWLNTFSFRDVNVFKATWEATDNLYGNLSTDRLGGWHQSQIHNLTYPFFDYPTSPYGPFSLGDFQHADLSVYSWQPTYAFGNSQAPPRFDRSTYKSDTEPDLYDASYLLNASTWDSYYLSTIPQSGVDLKKGMRLPNSRQYLTDATGNSELDTAQLTNDSGFNLSAANVMIHGGFNVNSTSVASWKAFLSGAVGQHVETLHSATDSNVTTAAAMGRFFAPLLEEPESVTKDRTTTEFTDDPRSWASSRTLNAEELETLAKRIVEEVKRRGPFLSLADFVNRRLSPDTDVTGDDRVYQEVLGTLQAAINRATLDDGKINNHFYGAGGSPLLTIKPSANWDPLNFSVSSSTQEAMFGYPESKINSEGGLIHNYTPNFLSQADVLTKIGPSITVRGDTYLIRSYGDSIDPATGEVLARAWCEAVVQRVAAPVGWDGSDDKLAQPQTPAETGFGRRFNIVSFRWLNEDDVTPYENDAAITQ